MPSDTLIYGFHPVREALRHRPHEVTAVYLSTVRGGRRRSEIQALCRRHDVPVELLREKQLGDLVQGNHNGFAARVSAATPGAEARGDRELLVLVEDVQDPRNLGALLRVCEGAGVGRVLVRDRGSAPLTTIVVRSSAGATEYLPVERITNTAAMLKQLRDDGFWTYGAAAEGQPPWSLDLTGKVVLCVGGEEKGLRELTRKTCDALVGLPMRGRVQSLNLATAAAAILYEAVRQRSA